MGIADVLVSGEKVNLAFAVEQRAINTRWIVETALNATPQAGSQSDCLGPSFAAGRPSPRFAIGQQPVLPGWKRVDRVNRSQPLEVRGQPLEWKRSLVEQQCVRVESPVLRTAEQVYLVPREFV